MVLQWIEVFDLFKHIFDHDFGIHAMKKVSDELPKESYENSEHIKNL